MQSTKKSQPKVHSVHVTPLPIGMKEKDLVQVFDQYKDLCNIFISNSKDHEKFTFGFVRFKSRKSANHAVQHVNKNIDGTFLQVTHANKTKVCNPVPESKPPDIQDGVTDKHFADAFEDTFKQYKDSKESLDSILKGIQTHRLSTFYQQQPTCASSLNMTEIITEHLDHEHWTTFFQEQREISKTLKEISQNPERQDSKPSESSPKEKEPEKDESNEGLQSPSQESANSEPKARNQNMFGSLELSNPENIGDTEHSNEENVPSKDIILSERLERNLSLENHLPKGRGRGLPLVSQNLNFPNQFHHLTQYRDLVKSTRPKMAHI